MMRLQDIIPLENGLFTTIKRIISAVV